MTEHGLNVLDPVGMWPGGIKNIRLWDCGVAWKDLNPAPNVYDFSRLNSLIKPGVNYTLVLGGTPRWAARDPHAPHAAPWLGDGSNSPPHTMSDWMDFVSKVMSTFRGRIKFYEVWNEPQLADFWWPYDQVPMLAKMTVAARNIARAVDPAARIVSASVLPRDSSGGMKRACVYLRALRAVNWPVDIYSAHIYPEIGAAPSRWNEMAVAWQRALTELGAPRKPKWVTETNFNLMGGPLKTKAQVERCITSVNSYADAQDIDRVYWYAYGVHSDPRVLGIRLAPGTAGFAQVFDRQ